MPAAPAESLGDLIPVLQTAIGPVILVSGVGLLLLSMTNRYGRVIDRARDLIRQLRAAGEADRLRYLAEVELLYGRARLLRSTITAAAASVLSAALLVVALFVAALLQWDAVVVIGVLFIACMALLSVSLVLFLVDLRISLRALRLEIGAVRRGG